MFRIFLSLFVLFTTTAYTQTERYLQSVDLKKVENRPYYSNSHSLPMLVNDAILSGKVTPYHIDYGIGSINPISLAEYKNLLIYEVTDYGYGEADTFRLFPAELNQLELDITRKKSKPEDLNYIHFKAEDYKTGSTRYLFSVSFYDLSQYLDKQNALWVTSVSPFVWKGHVMHTDGNYIGDILYQQENESTQYLHLVKNTDNEYSKFYTYNNEHKLVSQQSFDSLSSDTTKGEIRLMSEALFQGMYSYDYEEKLNTTLPDPIGDIKFRKLKDTFVVTFVEDIHLKRPENAKFYQEEKELSTLIMNAVESGSLSNIYTNDSLTTRMSLAEWQHNASEEVMSDNGGWGDEDNDEAMTISRYMYLGRSVSIVSIMWKIYFNIEGEVLSKTPHAIGLFVAPEETITGLTKLLGYFAFEDVYNALKDKPEAFYNTPNTGNYIEDLKNGGYFSYWKYTSGIAVNEADK